MNKAAWAEVSVRSLMDNIATVRGQLHKGVKLCGIIKADAYGHSLKEFSRMLKYHRLVDMVAVGRIPEVEKILSIMPDEGVDMLILGETEASEIAAACRKERFDTERVIFSVYSMRQFADINALGIKIGKRLRVHIRTDNWITGMGLSYKEFLENEQLIHKADGVDVCGLYAHLYSSYSGDREKTRMELEEFDELVKSMDQELRNRLTIHVANSAIIFTFPEYAYDMVRFGAAMYGLTCYDGGRLKQAMKICAKIFDVKEINAKAPLAYHSPEAAAKGKRKIARVMIGYWDCPLLLTQKTVRIGVKGKLYPLADDVCMDNLCIDVTGSDDIVCGDEAVILGEGGMSVNDVLAANSLEDIHSDWMCMTAGRLEKIYVK